MDATAAAVAPDSPVVVAVDQEASATKLKERAVKEAAVAAVARVTVETAAAGGVVIPAKQFIFHQRQSTVEGDGEGLQEGPLSLRLTVVEIWRGMQVGRGQIRYLIFDEDRVPFPRRSVPLRVDMESKLQSAVLECLVRMDYLTSNYRKRTTIPWPTALVDGIVETGRDLAADWRGRQST